LTSKQVNEKREALQAGASLSFTRHLSLVTRHLFTRHLSLVTRHLFTRLLVNSFTRLLVTRHLSTRLLVNSLTCLLLFAACDKFESNSVDLPEESEKVIDGTWKIIKAARNDADITQWMDFSKFRIKFNADNTYAIENYLPFAVKENGSWSLDDPQYPFHLILNENGEAEAQTLNFNYPAVNGKRIISLSFTPGCRSNVYTYVFEREITEN
jgi:hypothetical protein